MVDRFWVNVKGGEGGSGNGSIRRSRTNRFGKSDGWLYSNTVYMI